MGTTLYVTHRAVRDVCRRHHSSARVARVVYGADDPKGGAVRSCFEVLSHEKLNHQVEITAGRLGPKSVPRFCNSFSRARR